MCTTTDCTTSQIVGVQLCHQSLPWGGHQKLLFLLQNSIVQQDHQSESYNFQTELRLKREFKKKDRLLKYAFVYSQSENDEDQFNVTENEYILNASSNDTIDQNQQFLSRSENYKSQFLFREPISKKWSIDLEHLYKVNLGNQDRNTYNKDFVTEDYNILDDQFSNYFDKAKLIIGATENDGIFSGQGCVHSGLFLDVKNVTWRWG